MAIPLNMSLQSLDIKLPISSLEAYLLHINQIPMLSQAEEYDLSLRLQKENELGAAKKLILPHLRYVAKVAKSYMGYGLPLADLIQEGNIGLMKAVKRFNPEMGVRLVTFAMHWIKSEIHEYILRNWRIVKIATTKAQRKLFFNLRSLKKHLSWMTVKEINSIAKDLKVKPETVREMEMRLAASDASLNQPTDDEHDHHFVAADFLTDTRYNPAQEFEDEERSLKSHTIYQALDTLDERSQDIIRTRWLEEDNKATLQDLADKYQISAERVRQLEKNAMRKLKGALSEEII